MSFKGSTAGSQDDGFNAYMGETKYLDVGVHDVTITGLEVDETKNGQIFIKPTWETAEGASHGERIYPRTKAGKYSQGYLALLNLINDEDGLRLKYFKDFLFPPDVADGERDLKTLGSLRGLQATIRIGPATEGFDIVSNDLGGFDVVDVKEKKVISTQGTRKEAFDAGKEVGLYRAMPVIETIRGREVDVNTEAVKLVLAAK